MKRTHESMTLENLSQFEYQKHAENKRKKISKHYLDVDYWQSMLKTLTNPNAVTLRDVVLDMNATNACGLPGNIKRNSLPDWWIKEQKKYPREILIVEVGFFYEIRGVGSIPCVEWGNLVARGQPLSLLVQLRLDVLQRLIDALNVEGFTSRVYREVGGEDPRTSLRIRKCMQVCSRANPVYFRAITETDLDDPRCAQPVLYVVNKKLIAIDMITKTYKQYLGLSLRGIKGLIQSLNPASISSTAAHRSVVPEGFPCDHLEVNDDLHQILRRLEDDQGEFGIPGQYVESFVDDARVPLLKSTSDQLGICSSVDGIPDLMTSLLGKGRKVERDFLLNWILSKPTREGRTSMEKIISDVQDGLIQVSLLSPLSPSKIYGLLASGGICKDRNLLRQVYQRLTVSVQTRAVHNVGTEYLGLSQDFDDYKKEMNDMVQLLKHNLLETIEVTTILPHEFIQRNEYRVLNRPSLIETVELARQDLEAAFSLSDSTKILYSYKDNDVFIYDEYQANMVKCNNKKGIRKNSWTTETIDQKLRLYLDACERTKKDQISTMKDITRTMTGKFGCTLRLGLTADVVVKTAHIHLSNVISKGWNRCNVNANVYSIHLTNFFPHWLNKEESTLNNILMDKGKMLLLTAPNGYGKTTIIRSTMIACVLANAGLFVSCEHADIPELDYIMLRLPASDRPLDKLSSFESEMTDLQIILSKVNENSLICLDELARSTCPKEAKVICQAVMEYLMKSNCYSIFSTHIHSLLDKSYPSPVVKVTVDTKHRLVNGECRTSNSMEVCEKLNLQPEIIARARSLLGKTNQDPMAILSARDQILNIAKEITGLDGIYVPTNTRVPPYLTSSPCVYIIEEAKDLFYVGESKHVVNRQNQHLGNERKGDTWVYKVKDKSQSLLFETLIQRRAQQELLPLSSTKDSQHNV
jgi:hypothetical protein